MMDMRKSRSLTTLGNMYYEETVNNYTSKLLKVKQQITNIISTAEEGVDLINIKPIISDVQQLLKEYDASAESYKHYLDNQRTVESANELSAQNLVSASLHNKVDDFIEHLKSLVSKLKSASVRSSNRSYRSKYSGSSKSSHLTAMFMQHTVKVEEAKTRLKYAEEEAELIKQEAAIKASKALLTVKKELEEAQSGLGAIRKVLDFSQASSETSQHNSYEPPTRLQHSSHIMRYVQENMNNVEPPPGVDRVLVNKYENNDNINSPLNSPCDDQVHNKTESKENVLNPAAVPFNPYANKQNDAVDLARLVAKNQLLPKRLWQFNDEPARYLTWKYSFLNVMNEINATEMEQLDLLVNHLGRESKSQANNIRAANARNPEKAVRDIWLRLDSEYGSAETIECALKKRINTFQTLSDNDRKRFFDLSDLAAEVESVKCDSKFGSAFAYYDTSSGINDFVRKLPRRFQEKWATESDRFKFQNGVSFTPFSVFTKFLRDLARIRNDPSLMFENTRNPPKSESVYNSQQGPRRVLGNSNRQVNVLNRKTEVEWKSESDNTSARCPIHGNHSNHTLRDCLKFQSKSLKERKDYLFKNGYCLRCCGQKRHLRKNCKETVKCDVCSSFSHVTLLHPDSNSEQAHEGEQTSVKSACTEVCNSVDHTSKSCAKIVLVNVYPIGLEKCARKFYCMIDDQSNRSLATSAFFDAFGEKGPETEYVISSCAGRFTTSGRSASGYVVQSVDGSCTLNLPSLIECNDIPSNREEIPSPVVARYYKHLHDVVEYLPEIDNNVNIELLIGRDLIECHHVLDQRIGEKGQPYGQKLHLGWVIIGNVCLGKTHLPEAICVNKTSILSHGRPTVLQPCENAFSVKEENIFKRTQGDEKPGLSVEDRAFLNKMDAGFERTEIGQWQAPLPFRDDRPILPDNKPMALCRAKSFDMSLRCNPIKKEQVFEFMNNLICNKHAEIAPEIPLSHERWYLPMFAVFHPKKPNSVRVVFDSSAKFQNVSLNSVLLQGPNLCNSLLGILLRFRRERIAVTMDIEQMFYNFKVPVEERRYLRFLWHVDNDFDKPLIDYQMSTHVFGNSPSPSVASYGLRKIVEFGDSDVKDLVCNNFYVDDGLVSCATADQAIDLIHRTKQILHDGGNVRLHKFASNSRDVLDSFDQNDLAKCLKDLDLGNTVLPMQRSLGLLWNTETDEFTFKVNASGEVYTRRGLLSTINSVYDPIGFAQPVIVRGKLLLRDMCSTNHDWDEPLPDELYHKWKNWVDSLSYLEQLRIPRPYSHISFGTARERKVVVFSDASKDAIAAVAYLKLSEDNSSNMSFLLGKAKVAPVHGHTIPRLELCAAVLATQIAETIRDELDISNKDFKFFTDSQVVLGYLSNESRRFFVYVSNRVSRIRLFSQPTQWHYIASECNPADVATRPMCASDLMDSDWLTCSNMPVENTDKYETYKLVDPDNDKDIRPEVICHKVEQFNEVVQFHEPFSDRFSRFSSWNKLVRVISRIKVLASKFRKDDIKEHSNDPDFLKECEKLIIAIFQRDAFSMEIQCLKNGKEIPKSSSIGALSPLLGSDGLLRVGGRLNKVSDHVIGSGMRNPIILPKGSHISTLIVRHFHQKVCHQGRHFTEGAVRSSGFWIVGLKGIVASEIRDCFICRKLRKPLGNQQMSDLPQDRCEPSPPFSFVGVDTFGPWPIVFRKTRGGIANQKRWALMFTCLVTRAIHIEIIEELTSSAFINALRRLIAIRGPVTQFRSDRGTNFVGATSELPIDAHFVEDEHVVQFLERFRVKWKFNPPHSPHMGGAWERLIGVAKRILNAMLLKNRLKDLTHDVLVTLMSEVCAIINNRPLVNVTSDPDSPVILTPSMLLTMKTTSDVNTLPCFGTKDALRSTWKHVQLLAEEFWRKWKCEYLHGLQVRKKWQTPKRNFKIGDLVLVKDDESSRNYWPTGVIQEVFVSEDKLVRQVKVAVIRNGKRMEYIRPVTELVPLLEVD